tara:strand:- start:19761 stop:20432 length:672 start_codon:yes stop_codon:yes gene_type:complete
MSKTIVVLTLSLLSFYTAHAQDPYFEISKVEVTEVESAPIRYSEFYQEKNLNGVIMQAKGLLALGKEIWKIIEAGRPVSNHTAMQTITVLPKDEDGQPVDVMDMESWNLPSAKSYRVEYKNGFGMTVIGFTYTVVFQWGGSYNGKGKYLTGVNVMADDISVSWGFNFSADSQLLSITNTGTKENPVAAATLTVKYRAKSVMSDISSSETFYVTGSGRIGKLHK